MSTEEKDPGHLLEPLEVAGHEYTEEESRAIVKKFDWHILPFLFLMYLFNSLDKGNLSNAKSDGMTVDLNFPTNGYSTLLSVFYVPFCTLTIPGVMLTRKIGPRITLPMYMFGWGSLCLCNAAVKNFGESIAVRMILGAFEAGFAASTIFYLTTFYRRGELALRIAIFYTCNALSGAFSGLLAYGVFQAKSSLKGWQILFLIEGGVTVLIATVVFFMLPGTPNTSRFLDPRQKDVAMYRLLRDGSGSTDTKFQAKAFFKPLKDPKFYVFAAIALCYGTAVAVASNFLTQIIGRYHYSTVKTNIWTVAPYCFGAIVVLGVAFSSDRNRERGFHLAFVLGMVIVGCIILAALPITEKKASYFAVFLITGGAFTPSVIFHTWHQCNDPTEDGRAFRSGAFNFLANAGGIVSANIFQDTFAPKYTVPLIITACIEGLALALVVGLRLWMAYDNRKRNKAQGVNWTTEDVPTEAVGDGPSNPLFRHFL